MEQTQHTFSSGGTPPPKVFINQPAPALTQILINDDHKSLTRLESVPNAFALHCMLPRAVHPANESCEFR
eukprot:6189932-Pleurochrysis_carterae.AAC.1